MSEAGTTTRREEIERAVKRLRNAANLSLAKSERGEPWGYDELPDDGPLIGLLSPTVALALADWLDGESGAHVHITASHPMFVYDMPGMDETPALKIAREINNHPQGKVVLTPWYSRLSPAPTLDNPNPQASS